jgi:hypothetical protein
MMSSGYHGSGLEQSEMAKFEADPDTVKDWLGLSFRLTRGPEAGSCMLGCQELVA